jgi:hypothetical protein
MAMVAHGSTYSRQVCMGSWSFEHANWEAVSAEAKAIVASMLQVNPARRATAAVVLRSAWLLRHGRVGRALMGPGNALSPSQGDRQRRVHTDASAGTSLAASIKALRRTTTRRTTRRTSAS